MRPSFQQGVELLQTLPSEDRCPPVRFQTWAPGGGRPSRSPALPGPSSCPDFPSAQTPRPQEDLSVCLSASQVLGCPSLCLRALHSGPRLP